ncbi:unnamed protein product [Staurois parvus]|uniref:Uncharacterized protein n=1 Tax=Staurois parvus TaxID=386267 RepID=A0ABN9AD02_9NEOB|nr:unnamed protein product [Staurois parvus]
MKDVGGMKDGSHVEVCVLSSLCWPCSAHFFMDDPQKYFPSSLARPLLRFSTFFRKCPALPGFPMIGQSQQLQWTWLGKAEVQYGGSEPPRSPPYRCSYCTSNFNQQEDISKEEDRRNKTGVPDGLLRDCLEPLTAKTGILANTGGNRLFSMWTGGPCVAEREQFSA